MKSIGLKIGIGMVILLSAGTLAMNFYMDRWLAQELQEILNKNPNRSNNILIEELTSNIWIGDISLSDVKIIPISTDSSQVPLATIENFSIEGVSFLKLLKNKEVVTKTLIIHHARVRLLVSSKHEVVGDSEKVNALWTDILTRINVENFEIESGELVIQDEVTGKEKLNMININLLVTDIIMDTSTVDDPFPFLYHDIEFSADDVKVELKEFMLVINKIKATEDALNITELKLDPKPDDHAPQSLSITSEVIEVSHFDWGFIQEQFYLKIVKLEVTKAKLAVLQKRKSKYSSKEKPLLPATLRNLPIKLHVDSVVIKDTDIIYDQLNKETGEIGELRFTNFYSTAYHITNDEQELQKSSIATIDIQTRCMNKGKLKAQFHFDLLDRSDAFRASGSLDPMDLKEYNLVLKPLASVEVEGRMDKFAFAISGNKWKSSGSLNFHYDALHVNVLNQAKERKNVLLSSLGNFVINGTNQPNKSGYRIGVINSSKERSKSFFAYLWDSLRSGIVDVVAPRMADKGKKSKRKK
jgi:hypothetical protein